MDNYASDDPSDAMARNAVVNALHRPWHAQLLEIDPDVVYFAAPTAITTAHASVWRTTVAKRGTPITGAPYRRNVAYPDKMSSWAPNGRPLGVLC